MKLAATILSWLFAVPLGLIVLGYYGLNAFDHWVTFTDYRPVLDMTAGDPSISAMVEWAQSLPIWRDVAYAVTNGLGVLGGLLLMGRFRLSTLFLGLTAIGLAAGLAVDILMFGGMEPYTLYGVYSLAGATGVTLVIALLSLAIRRRRRANDAIA